MYLLVFIQNLLMNLADKILPMQPLSFGGITLSSGDIGQIALPRAQCVLRRATLLQRRKLRLILGGKLDIRR